MHRAVLVLALTASATAHGDLPERLVVAGDGRCPTMAAVARALGALHPSLRVEVEGSGGERVEVSDRGRAYEVRAAGHRRLLDDARRRCGERATAAALALTLMLDPPLAPPLAGDDPAGPLAPRPAEDPAGPLPPRPAPEDPGGPLAPRPSPPEATAAAARATAAIAPAPAPAIAPVSASRLPSPMPGAPAPTIAAARPPARLGRPSRIELELTGVVDGAPSLGDSAAELTGGAALRLTVGGRLVAGTLSIAGLAPATATSSGVGVEVARVPFDAGARIAWRRDRFELGADVGLALAILRLTAPALSDATAATRLDVGARLGGWLRLWLTSRLALQLGAQTVISFAPYDLVVQPAGKIATTPRLWLGGGLGLAARL